MYSYLNSFIQYCTFPVTEGRVQESFLLSDQPNSETELQTESFEDASPTVRFSQRTPGGVREARYAQHNSDRAITLRCTECQVIFTVKCIWHNTSIKSFLWPVHRLPSTGRTLRGLERQDLRREHPGHDGASVDGKLF